MRTLKIAQGGCNGVASSFFRSSPRSACAVHISCEEQHTKISVHHERRAVTRSLSLSAASASIDRPTLFSLPGLLHPSDFAQLANKAIRDCDSIRRELASALNEEDDGVKNNEVQKAKRTLHLLDDISNVVCTVIDAAELCRSTHATQQWRNGASDAFGILSEYIGSLNADERLYRSLRRFVFNDEGKDSTTTNGSSEIMAQLSPEYQRMAKAMRREFERDGIHLSYTQREEARELNNVIVGLESLFSNNITEKTKYYSVGEELAVEVEKVIPRHVLGQLVRDDLSSDGSTTLSSDSLLTNTLLAHSPSPQLRQEVYMESNTAIPENLKVLDALIQSRHNHSTLLGYKSYAHRVLSDRMVENPQNVTKFLNEMEKRSRGMFAKEMELLMKAKQYLEGDSQIQAWDVPFYSNLIKARRQYQRSQEDGEGSDDSTQGYFTVENSINGMKTLVSDLFGIEMKEVEIPIQERWDIDITGSAQDQLLDGQAGLRKFEFHHEHDGALGSMYFDLHPRKGKFVHAAHFTIRCGRNREDEPDRQLPIVALVCNLSPSSSGSDSLLSHSEVETLYHEFGHGVHSLLSRCSFQHLSGTRAAMDFVETPSHFFETFARDPSFLSRTLARHYTTRQPMSEIRAQHLKQSHNDFRSVEVQTQIVHSRFDQALFGENPCSPALGGRTTTDVFEQLHREAGVPFAVGAHWHSRFGHLVSYGAGYYGYLYSQVFAADIWSSCMSANVSSMQSDSLREGGIKIWKEMLIHGGSKNPKAMLEVVLGRNPSVEPFFEGISER
ncbi:hypothetical protein ACHAWT_001211 [Skeletonema menzelii]